MLEEYYRDNYHENDSCPDCHAEGYHENEPEYWATRVSKLVMGIPVLKLECRDCVAILENREKGPEIESQAA